jgi:hypothetical protein
MKMTKIIEKRCAEAVVLLASTRFEHNCSGVLATLARAVPSGGALVR